MYNYYAAGPPKKKGINLPDAAADEVINAHKSRSQMCEICIEKALGEANGCGYLKKIAVTLPAKVQLKSSRRRRRRRCAST